jgi:WD40 repeat protein/serine/threonine protein kinase
MANLPVHCPHCQAPYQVEESLLGRDAVCKHCGRPFVLALPQNAGPRTSPWPWVAGEQSGGPLTSASTLRHDQGRPGGRPIVSGLGPETWEPGDVVLDLYEVREVFTGGGRGLVYRVRHRGWNMDLAVKCPRPECFRSEQDKADFEQEAETWVTLGLHPHTVTCFYVRRIGDVPRVFAEYVSGGSLAEWVRTGRLYAGGPSRALVRILDVAIGFAWGLHHAHTQGLIHRDVKPGNVLLTAEGIAKVTDFGMAKARGRTEAVVGTGDASVLVSAGGMTPAFCSPEQALGRPVSRKTDVWSWGVSLLEMFAGAARWTAGYLAGGALEQYLERGPVEGRPAMPQPIIELLHRCFRSDPEGRPRDMLEILGVLQDLHDHVTSRRCRREPPASAKALADSLNNRALSLRDLHKDAEAERLWEEALAAGPGHPESTYNLGLTRWRTGRLTFETLVQQLREVCDLHPGQWLPPYLLSWAHLEQGNWRAAADVLENLADRTGPIFDEVRAALATARERLAEEGGLIRRLEGHTGWVSAVCCTPDGQHALSGSADGTLKLWWLPGGRCLHTFTGHREWVTSLALGNDGRAVLSGSADRAVRLWEVATGRCLRVFEGHTSWVLAVALSADGRLAISAGGDGLLKLWDTESGTCRQTLAGHAGPALALCFSADGRFVLSGSRDRTLRLWDLEAGQSVRTLTGHADKVPSVALSGDGQYALSGSADRTLKLWDVQRGECLQTLEGHAGGLTAVSLSPDGRHALSGSDDRTVKFWRLAGGRCLHTFAGHEGTVNSVCWAAGGRQAVSASADRSLALWKLPADLLAPYVLSRVQSSETALADWADYEKALARARQALAAGDIARTARIIREARAQPGYGRRPEAMDHWAALYTHLPRKALQGSWEGVTLSEHAAAVTSVCFSGDGQHALSGSADRTVRLWEVATGHCLRTFEGHAEGVTSVCLSHDDQHVLSAGADGSLRLWDVSDGRCLMVFDGQGDVLTSACLSGDLRLVLAGGLSGTLYLWEVPTGRLVRVLHGHTDPVHSVCLRPDGLLALSAGAQFLVRNESEKLFTSGQVLLWGVAEGRCRSPFAGQAGPATAVTLTLDGCRAVTGGGLSAIQRPGDRSSGGRVHLWELATGRCLGEFAGHAGAVTSICPSVDGRYVLSGSTDRTLRLWETATGACLRVFTGHADAVTSAALSADGRHALSGSADGTLKLWVLDWELEERRPADWDEGALPYLETFLSLHTPWVASPPRPRKQGLAEMMQQGLARLFRSGPADEDAAPVLARRGRPVWTEKDFQGLLHLLGCAGHGWLRPEGIRRRLEERAENWNGPPLVPPG